MRRDVPHRPEDGSLCPICSRPTLRRDFVSDHCHETDMTRDWICRSCNAGLGMFRDDTRSLKRAAAYVKRHRERHDCAHHATEKASPTSRLSRAANMTPLQLNGLGR